MSYNITGTTITIIPTLLLEKPVITGYFASIIETYHGLTTSKTLQLRCFQSS